jgi:hypothetical protein
VVGKAVSQKDLIPPDGAIWAAASSRAPETPPPILASTVDD